MISEKKLRYLIAGCVNTIFGYLVGVGFYKLLISEFHLLFVGVVTNIITISFSFVVHKLFVYKTKGGWGVEYLKSYITYGLSAIVGLVLLWIMVSSLNISIWLAQAFSIIITTVVSYLGHTYFTFKQKSILD